MAVTYREAGVNIDEGNALVERIKPLAQKTKTPFVLEGIGGFAGLCGLPKGMEEPILVSGTDGVGTKLKVAFATGRHDTIGQDLVAMCVNDILTTGATPLFFLDYFATGRLEANAAADVIKGIADGCVLSGCALLGGETAELPGFYADGEYDLAGFAVGVVDKKKLLGPAKVKVGDAIIAVTSTGLHSNGYSLARRVLETEMGKKFEETVPELGESLADALLRPTKIYAKAVKSLLETLGDSLHAMCHVTGGGVVENLPRVLPKDVTARLDGCRKWPALFDLIARGGPVELAEMRRTFNLGIGLFVVCEADKVDAALAALTSAGEDAYLIGRIDSGNGPAEVVYEGDPEGSRT